MSDPIKSGRAARVVDEELEKAYALVDFAFPTGPKTLVNSVKYLVQKAFEAGLAAMAHATEPETPITLAPVIAPKTKVLAVNAVIRLLLTTRAESALKVRRFDGNVTIPRDEAVAMSDIVEACLGINTDKLINDDRLFDTRP